MPGESGYFSVPEDHLDPHLFEGEHLRPDVRNWVLHTLYAFWTPRYHSPQRWSRVWIAGSGISYQWAAARGNGDLDVLIGVDWDQFFQSNPGYAGFSESDMAEMVNAEFHQSLWPSTANQNLNGQVYEVTFYVNPNSTDIRNIHPYAAYDLTSDVWTVRPPTGGDFLHPQAFYEEAQREAETAQEIIGRYNHAVNAAGASQPGSPGHLNASNAAALAASQAGALYDNIHLGRKQAFGPQGAGYGDYYNFRWQYHKQQGTAQALHAVASNRDDLTDPWGVAIPAADVVLRRAALWNRGGSHG